MVAVARAPAIIAGPMAAVITPSRARWQPRPEHGAIAIIVLLAALLRLWSLGAVPGDPFYDAAVRSMPLSLHNFLLGAYEPGGSLAVDKPPLDLWLQVLSTQVLGFGQVALKLPPALAGTAAVGVLYDAVRRVLGALPGLAAALAMATLPIALLTSRSDTMDSVAMLLGVVALWLLVRFAQTGRERWCYLAAAAMGLAFNVKLFQGLVPLPALALFGALVCRERRLIRAVGSVAAFAVVALAWLTLTLFFPASERPYAIGSTNGSAWNATFVYNGWDRITGAATAAPAGNERPANNSELARSALPITGPSPVRLFVHNGPLSGLRLGFMLLVALALGVPALAWSAVRPRGPDGTERAFAVAVLAWLVIGVVLYSAMARLHPRYTEGFTPAVAAAAGIGVAWALRDGLWQRLAAIAAALALAIYGRWLLGGSSNDWRLLAAGAIVAAVAAALPSRPWRAPVLAGGLAVAALALPLNVDRSLIVNHEFDSGRTGAMAASEVAAISAYLHAHAASARYEFAAADPSEVGALIVRDLRPILSLTSYGSHELTSIPRLRSLRASGQLRYVVIDGSCGPHTARSAPACSAGAAWTRAHGTDISLAIGLHRRDVLYRLR
jgi:4-amino-4-deoxy-L-arabinose transferase-like glycosyltransferase